MPPSALTVARVSAMNALVAECERVRDMECSRPPHSLHSSFLHTIVALLASARNVCTTHDDGDSVWEAVSGVRSSVSSVVRAIGRVDVVELTPQRIGTPPVVPLVS